MNENGGFHAEEVCVGGKEVSVSGKGIFLHGYWDIISGNYML